MSKDNKMKITKSELQKIIKEALVKEMGMYDYDDVEMDKDKQVSPDNLERLRDLEDEIEYLSSSLGDDLIKVLERHLRILRGEENEDY